MEQFPHLKFIQKITGKPRLFGGGEPNDRTEYNKGNRQGHSNYLSQKTSKIKQDWTDFVSKREAEKLAPLAADVIPIFLQINPDLINSEFDLQSFGIEIISEEEDGFIIGASLDSLQSLEEKINGFISEKYGSGAVADLWDIKDGNREEWTPNRILSGELLEKWNTIEDTRVYRIETSIAFDKPLGKEPDPNKQGGARRLERYRSLQVERDDRLLERETHFDKFVSTYGKRISNLIHLEDSFCCEIEITGKGLKDLVFNYPFVFEVAEVEELENIYGTEEIGVDSEFEILPPDKDSPEIGVIDSGIMENHKYIAAAIKNENSKSYIDGDTSSVDNVKGGGHGTKVAGAILYPIGVSNITAPYQLPCYIRNLKVLDSENYLVTKYPAELMKIITDENEDCSIYNLSINSKSAFRTKHMSTWAATIDSIIHGKNVLFIVSAGNILKDAIEYYIRNGENYPNYLMNPYSRLANPGQSSFALTVGSINHAEFEDANWKSLGNNGDISAYSRIGPGIWGKIKPDVVEFGGGLIVSKNSTHLIRENEHTATELIRSTLHGGGGYSKDSTGTSFATPKVTHIVAQLKKLYPDENINLLRALVIQGARLPNQHFQNPTTQSIKQFGYGLPSLERVTKNSEQRISFYNTGEIKAEEGHIYLLKLPDDLTNQGDEYDILVEVTLAYTAKVRRTRQKTKSYLSTWLDWTTSKIEESYSDFKEFALKEIENTTTAYDKEARKKLSSFPWKIRDREDRGEVDEINRNNSTAQKDWAIIKSYQLPKELSFAVRAHKGWDKNMEDVPYALTVSIEVLNVNVPIYEAIRIENKIEIPV
jgi:Subtilase family